MDTFNEFDTQGTAPQRNLSDIISHGFNHYVKIIGWSILIIVLIAIVSSLVSSLLGSLVGYNQLEAQAEIEDMMSGGSMNPTDAITQMMSVPGYKESIILSYVFGLLLYPVYAGFVYAMHKVNTGQSVGFGDFFIGFRQNTVQYIVYGLIMGICLMIAAMLCVIPVFFVLPLFFLGIPIILFENASATAALSKSFNIAKANYGTLLGVSFVAFLICIGGIILCGIGILATAPFFYAAMYSAYVAYNGVPRQIAQS